MVRDCILRRFLAARSGSFSVQFALLLVPVLLTAGVAIDYSRATSARSTMQNVTDAAALAAVTTLTDPAGAAALQGDIDGFLATAGAGVPMALSAPPTLGAGGTELCIVVEGAAATTFLRIANIDSIAISTRACASLPTDRTLEIALVLDVSSSMIDAGRFEPMQAAVGSFLGIFSSNEMLRQNTTVSLVPFSSRVSIGTLPQRLAWLEAHGGNPAVPARWTNPTGHYNASHQLSHWIDGVTPLMYHAGNDNYYWMGCIEPRVDVAMLATDAVAPESLSDASPMAARFVAMDANVIEAGEHAGKVSGDSFCPPPIVPLSNDFAMLASAVDALTSQGATRLDTGILGGWYTLSPEWQGLWGTANSPAAHAPNIRKVVLFMTDGSMNTQRGQSTRHVDWLCRNEMSPACNTLANDVFVSICDAMKAAGIEIYGISYDDESDTDNVRACASSDEHYFVATQDSGSGSYIAGIYEQIGEAIARRTPYLTR